FALRVRLPLSEPILAHLSRWLLCRGASTSNKVHVHYLQSVLLEQTQATLAAVTGNELPLATHNRIDQFNSRLKLERLFSTAAICVQRQLVEFGVGGLAMDKPGVQLLQQTVANMQSSAFPYSLDVKQEQRVDDSDARNK